MKQRRKREIIGRTQSRGIAVLIALVAMLAVAYAGMALMRGVDASTTIAGNMGLAHGATTAVDAAIEQAVAALFERNLVGDPTNDDEAQSYFASRRDRDDRRGIPFQLQTVANYPARGAVIDAGAGNMARYVIERMCATTGPATEDNCLLTPAVDSATAGTEASPEPLPVPLFRETIRVDGPAGSTVYAQVWLTAAAMRHRIGWRILAD